jgi:hypothetical protein
MAGGTELLQAVAPVPGLTTTVGHGNDSTLPGDKGRNHQVPS